MHTQIVDFMPPANGRKSWPFAVAMMFDCDAYAQPIDKGVIDPVDLGCDVIQALEHSEQGCYRAPYRGHVGV